MSLLDSEHVRIIDVSDNNTENLNTNDLNHLRPVEGDQTENVQLSRKEKRLAKKEAKSYKGIFFVVSMMTGVLLGRVTGAKELVIAGMILGFMFFIDPFYQKVMEKIENW